MADPQDAIVAAYGDSQRRAAMRTSLAVERLWKQLAATDLSASWLHGIGDAIVRAVAAGQLAAALPGQQYVDAMVAADRLEPDYEPNASHVAARSFSGVAADGRPLDSLLYLPVIRTKTLIKGGLTLQQAMTGGWVNMQRIVNSEVMDAGRGSAGVAMVANRTVTGYIRNIRPGACSRCAILAGRWYRYDADFDRHKHCQCYGTPSTRARPGRFTDPMRFFHGLSRAEQNRRFTIGGAAAIRDGADIYSVVNASRSVRTLDTYGRKVVTTLEGTTRRGDFYRRMLREAEQRTGQRFARSMSDVEQGLPRFRLKTPRLMPGEIYELAESRDELIRLLRRFGYLN
jgi:hypothetical protein